MSQTPTSQNIYNLIDNIEAKLNKRGRTIEEGNYYSNYEEINSNRNKNINDTIPNLNSTNNIITTQYEIKTNPINFNSETQFIQIPIERLVNANQISINDPNLYLTQPQKIISQSEFNGSIPQNDFYLKKLIRDEFSNLIIPYQNQLTNNCNILDEKIKNIQNPDIQNILLKEKDLNKSNLDPNNFTLKEEYDNKMLQINTQLNNLNEYNNQLKDAFEKMKQLNEEKNDFENENLKKELDSIINDLNNKINNTNSNINSFKNGFQMQIDNLSSLINNNNRDSKYDSISLENKKIKNDILNLQLILINFKKLI